MLRTALLAWMGWCSALADCPAQSTWRRAYGGEGSDHGRTVRALDDGGFLVAGSTGSFGTGGDVYVLRLDQDGTVIWSGYYGGMGAQTAVSCAALTDGFAVMGTTGAGSNGGYDILLLKLDTEGALVWERHIGSDEWDIGHAMEALADGFVLAGTTYGHGATAGDAWVVRTDLNGDTLWTRRFGGAGTDEALGLHVDPQGHVLVVGRTQGSAGPHDAFVARLLPDGTLDWMDTYGGDGSDQANAVTSTLDGAYVVVGTSNSHAPTAHMQLRKYAADGALVWEQVHGNEGHTEARAILERPDGGFAMAGYNSMYNAGGRDMVLFLLAPDGGWELGKNYGSMEWEEGHDLAILDDGYIVVGASEAYGPGARGVFVVRAGTDGETADDTVYPFIDPVGIREQRGADPGPFLYPNPSDGALHLSAVPAAVQLRFIDMQGRVVAARDLAPGTSTLYIDLPAGTYLVELMDAHVTLRRDRVLILR